ncbi:leucyl/phenylalanyl-tRNA--protein transferase [Rubellimicrobium roseum]|uniref:Leucyl/phenylalanyl-tRNA--protein transferase n=1 Tax=Rubellimicrobium roseum TaxID=687525 RepID=A0A5C4NKE7_9RHOB|nr:leucyl/phenylalanyl-tRNA--protein transferase [Rubellimicrobium roseum]TNC73868.1 leucyl/phenylalanyl-tRNA--protein transferase [Rubellimicrobium roseum]
MRGEDLTPEILLDGYRQGIFPMAESRSDPDVFWVDPRRRGIFPLDGFHVSRSLARTLRSGRFRVSFDADFDGVVQGCAERDETWISGTIAALYNALHARGLAHSCEVWEGEALAGGVYGVAIGAAFFGESMFSRRTDASKVALFHIIGRLRAGGFVLFDTQFLTPHLASLGAVEIGRGEYRRRLDEALRRTARFTP